MDDRKLGALFIDFDNIYVPLIELYGYRDSDAQEKAIKIINRTLFHIEKKLGILPIIRKAIADWTSYPDVPNELYTMGIKVVHVKSMRGKNSADIELSLSLQDILLTRKEIETLIVLAGDRDYLPIAQRVKERARSIMFYSFEKCLSGDIKQLVGTGNYWYLDPRTNDVRERGKPDTAKKDGRRRSKSSALELSGYNCHACGTPVTEADRVCPKCGGILYEEEEAREKFDETEIIQLLESIPPKGSTAGNISKQLGTDKEKIVKMLDHLDGRGIISLQKTNRWVRAKVTMQLDELEEKALKAALKAEEVFGPRYGHVKLSGFLTDGLAKALPEKSHLERKEMVDCLVNGYLMTLRREYYPWGPAYKVFNVNRRHPVVREMLDADGRS